MKAMKKVFAMLLALAMIVTAVPVADASAATYKLKAGSISKTLYAGRTHTLKLNGLTASKVKTTKWTVGKTSVVKLTNTDKTKAKMKLVGKGYTVVTAKVTLKTKKTKTYKAKITVKDPSIKVDDSVKGGITLVVGETKDVKATQTPGNATVKYASRDDAIATFVGGKVKAVAVGETTITVSAVCGTRKVYEEIEVKVVAPDKMEDGLTAILTNPVAEGYSETVLVNQKAVINVYYIKDGAPQAGKTVVLTSDRETGNAAAGRSIYGGFGASVTDANGVATFVIYNNQWDRVTSTDDMLVGSVYYKASVPSDGVTSSEYRIGFAALGTSPVLNDELNSWNREVPDTTPLVPGTNFSDKGYSKHDAARVITSTMAAPSKYTNEYVMSQQVSELGSTEHEITFTGGYPEIILPAESKDLDPATRKTDVVNFTTDKYHVYTDQWNSKTGKSFTLTEDPKKLTTATLNFSNLKLSEHTKLIIATFKNQSDADAWNWYEKDYHTEEFWGPLNESKFGYQVPLTTKDTSLCVKVWIESAGQVDLNLNDGFTWDSVDYVLKTREAGVDKKSVPLKDATVTWEKVDTLYEPEVNVKNNIFGITLSKGERLTYKVPVFPLEGNAVLTRYDANNKPIEYYVVETTNGYSVVDTQEQTNDNHKNTNVIGYKSNKDNKLHCYLVSEEELGDLTNVTTSTVKNSEDGRHVDVNSEKSGRMNLKGTVTAGDFPLDAEVDTVYTFVQWNATPYVLTQKKFVALLGQQIEVYGQLIDKNGNEVDRSGVTVTFLHDGKAFGNTVVGDDNNTTVTVVRNDDTTDKNGKAKLILRSSTIDSVEKITASCNDGRYSVKIVVADKDASAASLFWADANIRFTKDVGATAISTADKNPQTVAGIEPTVGSKWEYGVELQGIISDKDVWNRLVTFTFNGVGIQMTKAAGGVGTVTNAEVACAVVAESSKVGRTEIVSVVNSKTVTDKVTVSDGGYTFAGIGKTTINKKLTLQVDWKQDGIKAEFVTVNGTSVYDFASKDDRVAVYVRVTDQKGNPLVGKEVVFDKDTANATDKFVTDAGWTTTGTTVKTDDFGIAKIYLEEVNAVANGSTTVKAKIDGIETITQVYRWITGSEAAGSLELNTATDENGNYLTNFDNETGVITLVFKADIVDTSLLKEMITAYYDKNTDGDHDVTTTSTDVVKFTVKAVEVVNNIVYITVNRIDYNAAGYVVVEIANDYVPLNADKKPIDSVSYTMTSEDGEQYAGGPKFEIGLDKRVSNIGVSELTHSGARAESYAKELKDDVVLPALKTKVSISADKATISLPGYFDGEALGTGLGTSTKAEVDWEALTPGVMTFEVDKPLGRSADATTGSAISFKAVHASAGATMLVATVRSYANMSGVTSPAAIKWDLVDGSTTYTYIVTADAKGFVSMIQVGENYDRTISKDPAEAVAIGGEKYGIQAGIIGWDDGYTSSGYWCSTGTKTNGLKPNYSQYLHGGCEVTWKSSDEEIISVKNEGTSIKPTIGSKDGDATLTVTISSASVTYTFTYSLTVTSGTAEYTRLAIDVK